LGGIPIQKSQRELSQDTCLRRLLTKRIEEEPTIKREGFAPVILQQFLQVTDDVLQLDSCQSVNCNTRRVASLSLSVSIAGESIYAVPRRRAENELRQAKKL
jgi:hypothetical protein